MKVSNKAMAALTQTSKNKDTKSTKLGSENKSPAVELGSVDPAQIKMSKKAKQIQQAKAIAGDQSVDEAKVAKFQNLIDSGRYKMDSAKIADSLIDEHMKLPN